MVIFTLSLKEIFKKLTDGWCSTGSFKKIVKECINIVIWFQFGTIKVPNLLSMAEFFILIWKEHRYSVCSNYMLIQTCIKVCEYVSVTMVTR